MRSLLASSAALLVVPSAAIAADLPSTKAPPSYMAPSPIFSWTGFDIGAEGGAD